MSDSKYDFSSIKPKGGEDEDDPRTNFRITMSCANCRYYFYTGVKSRRGFCKLMNTENMNIGAYQKPNIEDIAKREGWEPVHSTNVCDKHMLRSRKYSIDYVEDYTGFGFEFDGTRSFEDDMEEDFEYDDDID